MTGCDPHGIGRMMKIKKYLLFTGGVFFIILFIVLFIPINEGFRKQKIMNGVYNLKLLGQAMLVYQEQNHCLPFDQNGNILFQKMPLQTISFKSYATPDIYNCKGRIQKDEKTDYIAFGASECFYDFFTNSRYVIDMKIKPDGSVVTYKKSL